MKRVLLIAVSTVAIHGFGGDLAAQGPHPGEMQKIYGDAANSSFGKAVSCVGDVDADGFPDFVVGAHAWAASTGAVFVCSGSNPNHVIWSVNGSGYESFGYSVSGIGDVDGDLVPDVIVGAPFADNPGPGVMRCGRVTLHSGASGAPLGSVYGLATGDEFGLSVSAVAGDLDGDGWPDFLVGAPHATNASGLAHGTVTLVSGRTPPTRIDTLSGGPRFGCSVSQMGGDVDGDGWPDFLVGAHSEANPGVPGGFAHGSATVFSGHPVAGAWPVIHKVYGDQSQDGLGISVSGLGDVDGDSIPDFIAGAYLGDDPGGDTDCGLARVYSGAVTAGTPPAVLYTLHGDSILDQFGFAVSAAGDLNNDGFGDLLVGAPGDVTSTTNVNGYARVFDGPTGAPRYTMRGDEVSPSGTADAYGHSVSGIGDINGDGFGDFIVGAPWDDDPHDYSPRTPIMAAPGSTPEAAVRSPTSAPAAREAAAASPT